MADVIAPSVISIDDFPPRVQIKETYTTTFIETMLRKVDNEKQYTVMHNQQKKSSTVWSNFGFPNRKDKDGKHQRIDGFASCFTCKATYVFQSDGTGSTKHLLRHKCSRVQQVSDGAVEGPLAKFLKPKPKIAVALSSTDSTKMKDELTKWICKSVRPFNIVSDIGLRDVLQTVLELGMLNLIRMCLYSTFVLYLRTEI